MNNWIIEFIDLWQGSESRELQKALDLKYQNLPKLIYKYRSFDKNNYAINNLIHDNVWLSPPNKFNDPYDSLASVDVDLIIDKVHLKAIKNLIFLYGMTNEEIAAMNTLPSVQKQIKETKESGSKDLKGVLDSLRNSLNVCSFTENKDNLVMWSHYANNHSGFCIEYDLSKIERENKLIEYLLPVIYTENIFEMTENLSRQLKGKSVGNIMLLSPLYKYKDWSYEKEWRLVLTDLKKTIDEFNMPKPKAIYLGTKISEDNKKNIIQIVKSKSINVYQMKMSSSEFKLVAEKLTPMKIT